MPERKEEQEETWLKEGEIVELYVPTIIYYSPPEEIKEILRELGEAVEECHGSG